MANCSGKIRHWSIAGVLAITVLGAVLHFVFDWTGQSRLAGLFVPVNESVWEHLKMGYWAILIFSALDYWAIRPCVGDYFFPKMLGALALSLTVLLVFYTYTAFTGQNRLWFDIGSYVLGVLVCQGLVFLRYRKNAGTPVTHRIGLGVLAGIGILFGVLTFYPPHWPIFKDHRSNQYGIGTSSGRPSPDPERHIAVPE